MTLELAQQTSGTSQEYTEYTDCAVDAPFVDLAGLYGNNNRTDKGLAYATLNAGADNDGAEATGHVEAVLSRGLASF